MLQPKVFCEDNVEVMHGLIRQWPFGLLLSSVAGDLTADHLPFVLHADGAGLGRIEGHIRADNPLGRIGEGALQVLAVFQGPQSYVSPAWYPSKGAHGKVVPTWNYVVVHAHGVLRIRKDAEWLLRHLDDLSRSQEQGRPDPWSVSDAPSEFIERQLRGLVGLEIEITGLQGTWKVSQNKTTEDAAGVAQGLRQNEESQGRAMAKLVAERSGQLSS